MKKQVLILFFLAFSGIFNVYAFDFSEDNNSGHTIYYTIVDETAKTVSVAKASPTTGDLEIPSTVTHEETTYTITEIGRTAFRYSRFTSIILPEGITTINEYAFSYNPSLLTCNLPSTVTSVGATAFSGCSGITSLFIPASVTTIGNNAFNNCGNVTSIVVEEGNTIFDSRDNCNAIIETATNTIITGCNTTVIPSTVTSITGSAFGSCTFESFYLPAQVTNISQSILSGCPNLMTITVDPQNTVYDSRDNSNAIIISESNCLLLGCKNTTIPNTITEIGDFALYMSKIEQVTIPASVTHIGPFAFSVCYKLGSIAVEEGNTVYDSRNNCNCIIETATNILLTGCKNSTIPDGIVEIYEGAFMQQVDLTAIDIPESVVTIGENAFFETGLETITFPSHLNSIGVLAIAECQQLTSITSLNTTPPESPMLSLGVDTDIPVHVPAGSVEAYQAAPGWSDFSNIIGDAPTSIKDPSTDITASILTNGNNINVTTETNQPISIYDITGRLIISEHMQGTKNYNMPTFGAYIVKVGNSPALKVMIMQ